MWKHRLSIAVGSLGFIVNGAYLAYEYFFIGRFPYSSPTIENVIISLGIPLGVIIGYLVERNLVLKETLAKYVDALEVQVEKRGKELRDITRYLESVIENAGDAIILAESGGNIMSWNKGAENLFGYTQEEAIGENLDMIVPVGRKDEFEEIFKRVMRGERIVNFQTKRQTKDGRVLDVLVTVSPIVDDHGAIIGTSGVIRDITEFKNLHRELEEYSKELEEKVEERTRELKESEEKYRLLVENANDGIYVRTLDGELTFVNRRYAEIYGYEPEELMGKNVRELKSPEEFKKLEAIFEKAIKEKKAPELIETKSIRKNGATAYLTIRPSLVIKDGEVVGIQGIVRDITRQRIMEDELKGYAQELEKASRLKDLYIDIIHHDLINPLGIIRNLTEFILAERDPDNIKEYASTLFKKVEDSIELVENAAMFQRIESGERMEFQKSDLKKYVNDAIDNLETLSKEKDIAITFNAKGDCFAAVNPLIGDVFSNLLSNAIKYSPEGTRVEVLMEDTGDDILVKVKDQGEGVPDEYKEKIFRRFERRMKEGVKGTGLGLAIVRRVVDLHHGEVWVEDNPEGGSIFCVTVPKERRPD